MRVVFLGLSITSSWGNGHATGYRGLTRALAQRGDDVVFLERDMPWYAAHRDLPRPSWCQTHLYASPSALRRDHEDAVAQADLVVVGSFVPDGVEVSEWVLERAGGAVAFYDIDTPVTIEKLRRRDEEYLRPALVGSFDLYLSFTGGPALDILAQEFGARRPEPFFCFVDEQAYRPVAAEGAWALSYLGTYSAGRQPALEELLLGPARLRPQERFAVAGPMYPPELIWPDNVERIDHLAPGEHPAFYSSSALTLNLTRPEMRLLGHSPSVRLFEAAACAAAIVSDRWPGIEGLFVPEREILLVDSGQDVLRVLDGLDEDARRRLGAAAQARVLREHTARRRAEQLHELLLGVPA